MSCAMSSKRTSPPWDVLTDDIWTQIFELLDFREKLVVQCTCRRFYDLLAHPATPHTWGYLEVIDPKPESVWQLCSWLQPRLNGVSRIRYTHRGANSQQLLSMRMMWHALVAATAETSIWLELCSTPFAPPSMLRDPSVTELLHRLTSLDIEVANPANIVTILYMTQLQHLRLGCSREADLQLLEVLANGGGPYDCHLHELLSLQLVRFAPAAFFMPGTAACLQQLQSLSLSRCHLVDGDLPPEMLRLPSLSKLELFRLPLRTMPDLRSLPALHTLMVGGHNGCPDLDASHAECSPELKAALISNPLGGATGLEEVALHGVAIPTQECAEAIERLPHLRRLAVDCLVSEQGAFWAATLQRRLHGRCTVELATERIKISTIEGFEEDGVGPDDDC